MIEINKVESLIVMVISSDFPLGQQRDDDHEEDAPYFTNDQSKLIGQMTDQQTQIQID